MPPRFKINRPHVFQQPQRSLNCSPSKGQLAGEVTHPWNALTRFYGQKTPGDFPRSQTVFRVQPVGYRRHFSPPVNRTLHSIINIQYSVLNVKYNLSPFHAKCSVPLYTSNVDRLSCVQQIRLDSPFELLQLRFALCQKFPCTACENVVAQLLSPRQEIKKARAPPLRFPERKLIGIQGGNGFQQ